MCLYVSSLHALVSAALTLHLIMQPLKLALHTLRTKLKSMNEAQRYVFKYSGRKHANKTFTSKQPTLRMFGGRVGGGSVDE